MAGGKSASTWIPDALVGVATVTNALIALLAHHFPYQDAPNHIARYVLMDRFWSGYPPPNIDVRMIPGPYLGIDLVGVSLVRFVGPVAAEKALALAAVVLLPLAMYALLRRAAPMQRGWALVGAMLAYSWFLLAGMLNFVIGVGLVFAWLAWWWPHREGGRRTTTVALALGAAALFTVHMAAALTTLVVVWTDAALAWYRAGARRSAPAARLAVPLAATATVGVLWAWAEAGGSGISGGLTFRSPASKLAAFGAPFYSVSLAQAGVMAGAYAVMAFAFWRANRGALRPLSPFLASSVVFLGLFLVFPKDVGGAGATDVRWLMPMYLLPFCAARPSGVAAARGNARVLWIPFAAYLVNAACMVAVARDFDRRLDVYDAALRAVPANARLLPLISDQRTFPRVSPYQEYALWHTVWGGGQVPGLWSAEGTREGDPPIAHMRYFSVRKLPYFTPSTWGATDVAPIDWVRVGREYDYIVQVGDADVARAYVATHAREVARVGAIGVYRVYPVAPAQESQPLPRAR